LALRRSLFRKYLLIFSALTGGTLLLSSLLAFGDAYREHTQAVVRLQQEKADAAAARLAEYQFAIEQRISTTAVTRNSEDPIGQRAQEVRLLRNIAAINEVTLLDAEGVEVLSLSRRERAERPEPTFGLFERVRNGRPHRTPIYFRDGGLFMTVVMAVGPQAAGVTIAEIEMEFLLDGISRIKVGEHGRAYAVDSTGRLIAHPELGLVLRDTSLVGLPQVRAALSDVLGDKKSPAPPVDLNGVPVLASFATVPQLGWFVFVEEPLSETYRPLYKQVVRGVLLVLAGMLLSMGVAVLLVRRMVLPIQALQEGATRIGEGDFQHRIQLGTQDELEALGDSFNRMAEHLQQSYSTLEKAVAERTRELLVLNNQLAALSATDGLTGIPNRRHFDETLAQEWIRAARSGQPLALGMLDVDWFKAYNDHFGHQAGDECLRSIARLLAASICRTGDQVARYGGEEFVFIAPATNAEGAVRLAHKVVDAIRAANLPHPGSAYGRVTISIGIAAVVPVADSTPERLIHAADSALYRAKTLGRNRIATSEGTAVVFNVPVQESPP
jgi:diguanylate cyclase (GGDEF)-like protein